MGSWLGLVPREDWLLAIKPYHFYASLVFFSILTLNKEHTLSFPITFLLPPSSWFHHREAFCPCLIVRDQTVPPLPIPSAHPFSISIPSLPTSSAHIFKSSSPHYRINTKGDLSYCAKLLALLSFVDYDNTSTKTLLKASKPSIYCTDLDKLPRSI